MSTATQVLAVPRNSVLTRARDYAELTKLRVTTLIAMTAWCGYYFGALKSGNSSLSWHLFHALLGIALISGGTAALNELMECDIDSQMRRTALRPLPAGRMSLLHAGIVGGLMTIGGHGSADQCAEQLRPPRQALCSRARDTLAPEKHIHAACMSFLNLSISRALVTTRHFLCKSHPTFYRCTLPWLCGLYHRSAAADTHLQYGWPWAGGHHSKSATNRREGLQGDKKCGRIDKTTRRLRQSAASVF